jgi:hypothetical protein
MNAARLCLVLDDIPTLVPFDFSVVYWAIAQRGHGPDLRRSTLTVHF